MGVMETTTLIGLIFMAVLGPAVGNYACSVVYRLPRGQTPFERHPYCGHCGADLQPKDLFPILSWLSTRGRCRYCKGSIPVIYTVIESVCLLVFVLYFLRFGMGELFLLHTGFAVFAIILTAIHWQQGWIAASIWGYAASFAILARTLAEDTIYGWVQSGVVMLVLALLLARLEAALRRQPFMPFATGWIWWLVLIALAVPLSLPLYGWLLLMVLPVTLVKTRLAIPCFAALAICLPPLLG